MISSLYTKYILISYIIFTQKYDLIGLPINNNAQNSINKQPHPQCHMQTGDYTENLLQIKEEGVSEKHYFFVSVLHILILLKGKKNFAVLCLRAQPFTIFRIYSTGHLMQMKYLICITYASKITTLQFSTYLVLIF